MSIETVKYRDPKLASKVWASDEALATTLLILFLDTYGSEALEWTGTCIRMEVHDDFGIEMPSCNFDRLMTAIQVLTTNSFFISLPDFNNICLTLARDSISYDTFTPADTSDIAWGITEAVLINPPDENEEEPFSSEIVGFISETIKDEGIIVAPDILRIGQLGRDLREDVRMNYSDDPDMFSAIWKTEKSKTDDINNFVKARLGLLIEQISALPLKAGNNADIAKKLSDSLAAYGNG